MGKGSYPGGHTIIGDNTPEWFGNGHPEMGGAEERRFRDAKQKLEDLQKEGKDGRTGKLFRQQLKAAKRELEEAEKALKKADRPAKITKATEQDIADVRKHVRALAASAKSAVKLHEEERSRLERMLRENGFDLANYPEVERIDFSGQS